MDYLLFLKYHKILKLMKSSSNSAELGMLIPRLRAKMKIMAMRKRADGIVPLCDLAAREKTSVSKVVEEIAPRMTGGAPTSSRDSPLDQVQPHHPKENPAVAGGV